MLLFRSQKETPLDPMGEEKNHTKKCRDLFFWEEEIFNFEILLSELMRSD